MINYLVTYVKKKNKNNSLENKKYTTIFLKCENIRKP